MFYQKIPPPDHLKPFVECFFIWECTLLQPLQVESPPSGFCSMVFNYGARYRVRLMKTAESTLAPQVFLTGQSTCSYELTLTENVGMAGIVFRPAGLKTLFNLPLPELTDERIDLTEILKGKEIHKLADKISASVTARERVQLLMQFLNIRLLRNECRFDYIDFAANRIVNAHGVVPIKDLTSDIWMSRRQFERKFFEKVGLSPKYYARIRRMGYLCSLMAGKRKVNWQSLLFECGYYDQAHFIKDFTEFLGRTPTEYIQTNTELTHFLKSG